MPSSCKGAVVPKRVLLLLVFFGEGGREHSASVDLDVLRLRLFRAGFASKDSPPIPPTPYITQQDNLLDYYQT
jgi:hypothetical protein